MNFKLLFTISYYVTKLCRCILTINLTQCLKISYPEKLTFSWFLFCFVICCMYLTFFVHTCIHFFKTPLSPDAFLDIFCNVFAFQRGTNLLTPNNQALLFMIWLRCYSTCHIFFSLFNISVTTVKQELTSFIELFHVYC